MKHKKKHERIIWITLVSFLAAGWFGGCAPMGDMVAIGSAAGMGGTGAVANAEFGATQGGVQDLNFARSLIAKGQIPPPESLTVQAAFSEYDLPLKGTACEKLLCLRGATGVAADLDARRSLWLQIGMSSNLDPESWQRPALSLILVVDVSGSMSWTYGDNPQGQSPDVVAEAMIRWLATVLGDGDRVALVTYGSRVQVPLPASAFDKATLEKTVETMDTGGATNMESGLKKGYELAYEEANAGHNTRVLLFTDEQPNVGDTSVEGFGAQVRDAAKKGIGITVFGLGLGLGAQLMLDMSQLENANAFSLGNTEEVAGWYDSNWPWSAIPLAYNLEVDFQVPVGYRIGAAYGIAADPDQPGIAASTIFLSRNRGAILLRYDPTASLGAASTIEGTLRYEDGSDHSVVNQSLKLSVPADSGSGESFAQSSVGTAQMIAVGMQGMTQAVSIYQNDTLGGQQKMKEVVDWFAAHKSRPDAFAAGDELEDMAQKIYELMGGSAKTGNLYGEIVQ